MDVETIKIRVLMLEAQKAGIEIEINKLREIKCPLCEGEGEIRIGMAEGTAAPGLSWQFMPCKACERTGRACGKIY